MITEVFSLDAHIEYHGDNIPAPDSGSPLDQAHGNLMLDQILLLLSTRQQAIVLLRLAGYEKQEQISRVLGVSVSTVERETTRIRQKVKDFQRGTIK